MTKNMDRINELADELMPSFGKADNMAGELVRAACRIGYRFYNDGDHIGVGYGNETCNPAARFLGIHGTDEVAGIVARMWGLRDESLYEDKLDALCRAVADMVESDPSLRTMPAEDMLSLREPEDEDYEEEEDLWD